MGFLLNRGTGYLTMSDLFFFLWYLTALCGHNKWERPSHDIYSFPAGSGGPHVADLNVKNYNKTESHTHFR